MEWLGFLWVLESPCLLHCLPYYRPILGFSLALMFGLTHFKHLICITSAAHNVLCITNIHQFVLNLYPDLHIMTTEWKLENGGGKCFWSIGLNLISQISWVDLYPISDVYIFVSSLKGLGDPKLYECIWISFLLRKPFFFLSKICRFLSCCSHVSAWVLKSSPQTDLWWHRGRGCSQPLTWKRWRPRQRASWLKTPRQRVWGQRCDCCSCCCVSS